MNFRNVINLLNRCLFEHSLCVLEVFVDVHKTGFPALSKQTVNQKTDNTILETLLCCDKNEIMVVVMRPFFYRVVRKDLSEKPRKRNRSQLCKNLRIDIQVKGSKSKCPEVVGMKRRKALWARKWGRT